MGCVVVGPTIGRTKGYPNTYGLDVSGSGTAHVKGSYAELTASTDFSAHGCYLSSQRSATPRLYLSDVAIGAAASEQIILSNSMHQTGNDFHGGQIIPIPVHIPASTRVAVRTQINSTTGDVAYAFYIFQSKGPQKPPNFSVTATGGANTATTRGLSVDPGAVADTKGAYSELSSGIGFASRYMLLQFGTQGNQVPSFHHWQVDIAIGAAASEQIIIDDIWLQASFAATVSDTLHPQVLGYPIETPTSTRWAVRAQCVGTNATDRLIDCTAARYA